MSSGRRVALLTLGCARNEVDSEELAGRLNAEGWELVDDADQADAVLVNTFPSRQAFIATLNHPDYKAMSRHRDAGLLAQDLIVTRPLWLHGEKQT